MLAVEMRLNTIHHLSMKGLGLQGMKAKGGMRSQKPHPREKPGKH
jgi:hypothetical protein